MSGFADRAGNINSSYGAANAVFSGFRAYDAVQSALSSPVSASIGVGFSYSSSESNSTTNTAITSDIFGGEGLTITAHSGDISAFGANIGSDGSITLDAAQNLLLSSALSTSQNSSENSSFGGSIGFGIGGGGLSPTGSVNASFGESEGWTSARTNTHVDGADVILSSGNDTTIAGGRISGDTITVEVGGDFDLHSLQNTGERSNSNAGFGVGFGASGITSVSPSFGVGSGSTVWVTEQTGLFSSGDVDVSVGGATDLIGSVIGSTQGNVTIDTATLTHANLSDTDTYTDFGISVTFNASLLDKPKTPKEIAEANQQQNAACQAVGGCTSSNISTEGHYAFDDRAQNTNATIGTGSEDGTVTVTIRDTEAQQELEDSGQTAGVDEINRDLDTAQVVTRDEHERVDFYLSDSSLQAAADGIKVTANAVGKAIDSIVAAMVASGEMSAEEAQHTADLVKAASQNEDIKNQLISCATQQGFNLWHLIITPAYAANVCRVEISGDLRLLEPGEAKRILQLLRLGVAAVGTATAGVAAGILALMTAPAGGSLDEKTYTVVINGVSATITVSRKTDEMRATAVIVMNGQTTTITMEATANGQYVPISGTDANGNAISEAALQEYTATALGQINVQTASNNGDRGDPIGVHPDTGEIVYENDGYNPHPDTLLPLPEAGNVPPWIQAPDPDVVVTYDDAIDPFGTEAAEIIQAGGDGTPPSGGGQTPPPNNGGQQPDSNIPDYVFRGTSVGYPGNASTDPLVSAVYCVHASCVAGQQELGIFSIYDTNDLANRGHSIVTDTYSHAHDSELLLEHITPTEANNLASIQLTIQEIKTILDVMGLGGYLPGKIHSNGQLREDLERLHEFDKITPLSPEQIHEFVRRAQELRGR